MHKRLKKTERAVMNGQSREHTRNETKANKQTKTTKTKHNAGKIPGANPCAREG